MRKLQRPQLSIVLPFYNEKGNIVPLLSEYERFNSSISFELICVNNGSTDNSAKEFDAITKIKNFNFIKVVNIKKNTGYGHGIMTGVKQAKGEIIAWTHADRQTDPADVFIAYEIYNKEQNKLLIVKGNRIGRPLLDTLVSNCMSLIASKALGMKLYEINAQPKLFHHSFVKHLKTPPNDFLLDLYFMYVAKRLKYKINSFTVTFNKRTYGKSKWAYSWRSRLWMVKRTINYIAALSKGII